MKGFGEPGGLGGRTAPAAGDDGAAEFQVAGRTLRLLPEKAIHLADAATLLVADVHIGKATSFRQLGVPVPAGTTDETLAALTRLVERLAVRHVVFLGDLLHSRRSLAPDTLASVVRWRQRHAGLELTLIRGNHDDRAGDPPAALGVRAVDEPLRVDGLALAHHPRRHPRAFVLAGHLHPCVGLGGRAHDFHRLPCFWFSGGAGHPEGALLETGVGVLPAFGAFTGMHPIRARRGDRIFVVGGDRVHALPEREAPR